MSLPPPESTPPTVYRYTAPAIAFQAVLGALLFHRKFTARNSLAQLMEWPHNHLGLLERRLKGLLESAEEADAHLTLTFTGTPNKVHDRFRELVARLPVPSPPSRGRCMRRNWR